MPRSDAWAMATATARSTATSSSPPATQPPAGYHSRPRTAVASSSPTSATASAVRSSARVCCPSTRSVSVSPPRLNAPMTPSRRSCCRTSAGSATATTSPRRSPTACAPSPAGFMAVPLTREERTEYDATEGRIVAARRQLKQIKGIPHEPFGDFLAAVHHLAANDAGPDGRAANEYLNVLVSSGDRGDQFGEVRGPRQVRRGDQIRRRRAAVHRNGSRCKPCDRPSRSGDQYRDHHGDTGRSDRSAILEQLRDGTLDAVAAPCARRGGRRSQRNLGLVVSASRTRRQMIQRMGRIRGASRSAAAPVSSSSLPPTRWRIPGSPRIVTASWKRSRRSPSRLASSSRASSITWPPSSTTPGLRCSHSPRRSGRSSRRIWPRRRSRSGRRRPSRTSR